ncbi:MAG: hypothetical protein ABEJ02_02325 [Candidatus Paceibacteria bacterium]
MSEDDQITNNGELNGNLPEHETEGELANSPEGLPEHEEGRELKKDSENLPEHGDQDELQDQNQG